MKLRKKSNDCGGSKLNLLITLAILGAVGFSASRMIPIYFANYQFQDAIENESRFALTGYPKRTLDDIQDEVYKKAQDLGIPTKREDIHVELSSGQVSISLDYSVPVDLSVYQFSLQFHPRADNHSI